MFEAIFAVGYNNNNNNKLNSSTCNQKLQLQFPFQWSDQISATRSFPSRRLQIACLWSAYLKCYFATQLHSDRRNEPTNSNQQTPNCYLSLSLSLSFLCIFNIQSNYNQVLYETQQNIANEPKILASFNFIPTNLMIRSKLANQISRVSIKDLWSVRLIMRGVFELKNTTATKHRKWDEILLHSQDWSWWKNLLPSSNDDQKWPLVVGQNINEQQWAIKGVCELECFNWR